jgi:hypothetical protein
VALAFCWGGRKRYAQCEEGSRQRDGAGRAATPGDIDVTSLSPQVVGEVMTTKKVCEVPPG